MSYANDNSTNCTTFTRALADGMTPAALIAVADWNERKGYDERRRKARARHKSQAIALRIVAAQLSVGLMARAA